MLGVGKFNKMRIECIRELSNTQKGVSERINEYNKVERLDASQVIKQLYSDECVGKRSVGSPKKMRNESIIECLKGRNVNLVQTRGMMHNWSEWRDFMRRHDWESDPKEEPRLYNSEICLSE